MFPPKTIPSQIIFFHQKVIIIIECFKSLSIRTENVILGGTFISCDLLDELFLLMIIVSVNFRGVSLSLILLTLSVEMSFPTDYPGTCYHFIEVYRLPGDLAVGRDNYKPSMLGGWIRRFENFKSCLRKDKGQQVELRQRQGQIRFRFSSISSE